MTYIDEVLSQQLIQVCALFGIIPLELFLYGCLGGSGPNEFFEKNKDQDLENINTVTYIFQKHYASHVYPSLIESACCEFGQKDRKSSMLISYVFKDDPYMKSIQNLFLVKCSGNTYSYKVYVLRKR